MDEKEGELKLWFLGNNMLRMEMDTSYYTGQRGCLMIPEKLKLDPAKMFPDLREEEESGAEDASEEDEDTASSSGGSEESSKGDNHSLPEDSFIEEKTEQELVRLRKAMVKDSPIEAYFDGWVNLAQFIHQECGGDVRREMKMIEKELEVCPIMRKYGEERINQLKRSRKELNGLVRQWEEHEQEKPDIWKEEKDNIVMRITRLRRKMDEKYWGSWETIAELIHEECGNDVHRELAMLKKQRLGLPKMMHNVVKDRMNELQQQRKERMHKRGGGDMEQRKRRSRARRGRKAPTS
jgi:hypothetical protein